VSREQIYQFEWMVALWAESFEKAVAKMLTYFPQQDNESVQTIFVVKKLTIEGLDIDRRGPMELDLAPFIHPELGPEDLEETREDISKKLGESNGEAKTFDGSASGSGA
jgi:hypothetical protein